MWIFDKLFNRKIEGKSSLDSLEVLADKVSIDEDGYIVFTGVDGGQAVLSAGVFKAGNILYEDDGIYTDEYDFLLTDDGKSRGVQSVGEEGFEPAGKVLTSDGAGGSSWESGGTKLYLHQIESDNGLDVITVINFSPTPLEKTTLVGLNIVNTIKILYYQDANSLNYYIAGIVLDVSSGKPVFEMIGDEDIEQSDCDTFVNMSDIVTTL